MPYQSVSKSAGRLRLSWKNLLQLSWYRNATGRFTTAQASTAPPTACQYAPIRRARMHSGSSGMRNSPG